MSSKVILNNLNDFIHTRLYWDEISANYRPETMTPSWPSIDDCLNYFLASEKFAVKESALVLGATPYLRKLCRNYKTHYVADFSRRMLNAMNKYIDCGTKEAEIIYKINWFRLDRYISRESLDLIVGDLAINSLPLEKDFFSLVSDLLKPGGYFLTRIQFKNLLMENTSNEEIINITINKKAVHPLPVLLPRLLSNKVVNKKSLVESYEIARAIETVCQKFTNLWDYFSDKDHYLNPDFMKQMQTTSIYQLLMETAKLQRITNFKLWLPEKEDLEAKIKKYFSIKEILKSEDYYDADYSPIYVMQKPEK